MAIESVAFGGAAHQSSSTRNRVERQREERPAPDLYATSVANTQTLIGALGPNATETKRINNLIASAKAAAVQLVTQPVEAAPTEKVKSVSELLDGVGFNKAARTAPAETRTEVPESAPVRVKPPVAAAPAPATPVIPIVSPAPSEPAPVAPPSEPSAPPVVAAPAEPTAPATPAPGAPEPTPPVASSTPPASTSPAPASPTPSSPPSSTTPTSPAPNSPPASTPPSSSGGNGGLLGGLFGRR